MKNVRFQFIIADSAMAKFWCRFSHNGQLTAYVSERIELTCMIHKNNNFIVSS